eukprot:3360210-Rhodomonas_salina.1
MCIRDRDRHEHRVQPARVRLDPVRHVPVARREHEVPEPGRDLDRPEEAVPREVARAEVRPDRAREELAERREVRRVHVRDRVDVHDGPLHREAPNEHGADPGHDADAPRLHRRVREQPHEPLHLLADPLGVRLDDE